MGVAARLRQRLFRWQSDGRTAFRLGQRRVFILPSRAGLLFALTLLVMLLGAINYDLSLGHLLVFLLAGLGLTGMIHSFRNLHGLGIAAGRCAPVFAGEPAHFNLRLDNERPTPRLALFLLAPGEEAVRADLPAGGTVDVAVTLPARQRGWLPLPRLRLETRYPLGLFVAWSYLQPEMRCLVYPAPRFVPLPPDSDSEQGEQGGGDGGDEDFAGLRERQPADSPRHVAWKAAARDDGRRPLQIKQFAGGMAGELWLDWQLADGDDEARLSVLCAWVLAAEAEAKSYGLRLPGQEIPPGRGDSHRQRCLEALALYPA